MFNNAIILFLLQGKLFTTQERIFRLHPFHFIHV